MSKIQKIYDYLKECNGFFFASCDGDKPRVRPFGFMMIFEDKLYFGMGTHKESYKQVKANPNVEICAMNPDGSFIRVKGVANFDMRPEVQAHMFEVSACASCIMRRLVKSRRPSISPISLPRPARTMFSPPSPTDFPIISDPL